MLGKQYMFSFSRDALEHKYMKHLNTYVCISCFFWITVKFLEEIGIFFLSSFIWVLCLTLVTLFHFFLHSSFFSLQFNLEFLILSNYFPNTQTCCIKEGADIPKFLLASAQNHALRCSRCSFINNNNKSYWKQKINRWTFLSILMHLRSTGITWLFIFILAQTLAGTDELFCPQVEGCTCCSVNSTHFSWIHSQYKLKPSSGHV